MKEIIVNTKDDLDIFKQLQEIFCHKYHFLNYYWEYNGKPKELERYILLIQERNLLGNAIEKLLNEIKNRCERKLSFNSEINLTYIQQMILDVNFLIEISKKYSNEQYKISDGTVDMSNVTINHTTSDICPNLTDKSKKLLKFF